jgi:uncharacterized protein YdiU (UPF0061 family)
MPPGAAYRPETRHAELGPAFYDVVAPAQFPARILRFRNQRWAARVGLEGLDDAEWLDSFALPGSFEAPLALRYHGHQFRSYNPDLGDGRGFLFAQLRDDAGRLLDLGTKGSGRTPWSRAGDGRLTLKGGVREVLATEMLEALGVETSKTFSLVETGEALHRGDEPSPTRSSVMVRLSHSHIRIGTFQRLLALGERAELERLLAYCVETYLPEARGEDAASTAVRFLAEVTRRVARMGAQWTAAGFVHGVLNTDNINITGESFDYGPWRFLPTLDLGFTAAYFDTSGLYAYGRQPQALLWNLARLAECLTPFTPVDPLKEALGGFDAAFDAAFRAAVFRRLGLDPADAGASRLPETLWTFLESSQSPFDRVFFDLHGGDPDGARRRASPIADAYASPGFAETAAALAQARPLPRSAAAERWFSRAAPVTLLIEDVEAVWAPIAERDDWSAFETKIAEIRAFGDALAGT